MDPALGWGSASDLGHASLFGAIRLITGIQETLQAGLSDFQLDCGLPAGNLIAVKAFQNIPKTPVEPSPVSYPGSAYSDALTLAPLAAGPLIGRAQLLLGSGDVAGALRDTQTVIDRYPRAEHPWNLRSRMAERLGRLDLALEAFEVSTGIWPSDAVAWFKLGLLLRQRGDREPARLALDKARALQPSLTLPGAGPLSQH